MEERFWCPYLGADVALTDERVAHMHNGHPEVSRLDSGTFGEVIGDPDRIMSRSDGSVLFVREAVSSGSRHWHVVAVRRGTSNGDPAKLRYWVVTAWTTRRTGTWSILWTRT